MIYTKTTTGDLTKLFEIFEDMVFDINPKVTTSSYTYETTKCSYDEYDKETGIFKSQIILPGFTKEEIDIEVKKEQIIIIAKKETKSDIFKDVHYVKQAKGIDPKTLEASLENGVINLSWKQLGEYQPMKIKIS